MLILLSNGLTSKRLMDKTKEITNNCTTAALVVTADNEYKEKNYHVQRCVNELKALNLSVDLFDIDEQSSKLLLDYDVVEFIGGNPFYLLYSIRKYSAYNVLKN